MEEELITKDLEFVEKKQCITFSKICCNLGKIANFKTGFEEYYCYHDFPVDCSKFGCPHYVNMSNPSEWRLKKLGNNTRQR